ncbi:hypothetical protein BGW39_011196 [Mortierella sp. 14UC]|nr:hypothetical protein BGW39_011196 [Mortierella sp. 14UC]
MSSSNTPTTANPSRNAESPRSRHNTASTATTNTTMATTPAFAFMGQGTSSATVAARVTPAAASGTTAAPASTTMTTATSASAVAGVSAAAGITSSSSTTTAAAFTIPAWSNGALPSVAATPTITTALPTTAASTPFSGLIFGPPAAAPLAFTTTTPVVAGGGSATSTSFAAVTGTPATSTISTGSGATATAGQTSAVPTTTTTTHTALRFTPVRPWGINFNTNTNSSPTTNHSFGNRAATTRLASATPPPGPGRYFNNFSAAPRRSLAFAATQPTTASTSVFTPSTQNNGNPQMPQLQCTKEIRFRFEWSPDTISILLGAGFSQQFQVREGDVDTLQCSLLQSSDTFKMTLDFVANLQHKGNNSSNHQSWLQTVSTYTVDQKRLATVSVFWPDVRTVHLSWPKADTTLVKNAAGRYAVEVLLSSEKSSAKLHTTTSTTYTDHCDSILGKMLDDPSSYDVFFEFDPPAEFLSEFELELDASGSETGSIEKIEAEDDDGRKQDDEAGAKETEKTVADKTERIVKETSVPSSTASLLLDTRTFGQQYDALVASPPPPATTSSSPATVTTVEPLGAHKIVLSQYEYFKTMFSSSFAEGGPGVKRIKIKDSDIHCFRLLIQFLYLGRLRPWNAPTVLTQDCLTPSRNQPSWEDVYLIADRYNIPELKVMAGTRIIQGLSSEWAVPFLFRTGYLFEEMRQALIKYVVKNNMDEISHKRTQEMFFEHPECTAIFGEIIAELWSSKSS